MKAPALADAATQLPWLSPGAASLQALTGASSAGVWSEVRHDPGCVLLIVRQSAATQAASALSFFPALVCDPAVLDGAVYFLEAERESPQRGARSVGAGAPRTAHCAPSSFVDWNHPAVTPIYHASLSYARLAWQLADRTGSCDPENAWIAALLAPLGWLAMAAVAVDQVVGCLADPRFVLDPERTQERWWGLDQAGIARRLSERWQLPRWLAVVPGYLGLPLDTAKTLGADPDLFRIVQLAVRLAQEGDKDMGTGPVRPHPHANASPLHLAVGATMAEAAGALGLSLDEAAACRAAVADQPLPCFPWESPHALLLLCDLLGLAADNRRLSNPVTGERWNRDVDTLHRALQEQIAGETERLLAQKLSALAEFAAGAGHEINNPLAVISGQAQYLLSHFRAEERKPSLEGAPTGAAGSPSVWEKSLQTIIGQTRRIHHVLTDLMQFARPPRPQKQQVDVGTLVREVTASLEDLASQRRVRFVVPNVIAALAVDVDPQQVAAALSCLLRNALEAAPPEGWAGVRLEAPCPDRVDLVVEDNGSGPPLAQREHLFDPFYSGRSAGRGRGLGLATAWRLARENGGDVRFDCPPDGPTRFILGLPTVRNEESGVNSQETVVNSNGVGNTAPAPVL